MSETAQTSALPADIDHPAVIALFEQGRASGTVDSVVLKTALEEAKISMAKQKAVLKALGAEGIEIVLDEVHAAQAVATTTGRKSAAKKSTAKKTATKTAAAKKTTAAKTTTAKKAAVKKTAAQKAAEAETDVELDENVTADEAREAPAKKAAAKKLSLIHI